MKNAAVAGLTLDGNRDRSQPLDGCRGGGIYLFECANVTIRDCTVCNYNGDGISFQVSQHVTVEDCRHGTTWGTDCTPAADRGIRSCAATARPATVGMACSSAGACVRDGSRTTRFNPTRESASPSATRIRTTSSGDNRITENDSAGVAFRDESSAMGAHRNRFEKNVILDNGIAKSGAAIVIRGEHHDLVFRENVIGYSKPRSDPSAGVRSEAAKGLKADENDFRNVTTRIEVEKKRAQ